MGTPTPNTVKITGFDLNTGIFKGTFLIAGATSASNRTAAFEGVLIPRLNRGFGQFQLPGLSPSLTASDILSGQVVLGQNP